MSVQEGLNLHNFKLDDELRVWGAKVLCTSFDCEASKTKGTQTWVPKDFAPQRQSLITYGSDKQPR